LTVVLANGTQPPTAVEALVRAVATDVIAVSASALVLAGDGSVPELVAAPALDYMVVSLESKAAAAVFSSKSVAVNPKDVSEAVFAVS